MAMGRACPLCPGDSDINLFGNRERVVNLDAEIAHRAFERRREWVPNTLGSSPMLATQPVRRRAYWRVVIARSCPRCPVNKYSQASCAGPEFGPMRPSESSSVILLSIRRIATERFAH
jgi:hypothetical protein